MTKKSLLNSFNEAKKISIKNTSYFDTYEYLFRDYVGKNITFVEVGVFNGGSLHMWRSYFGENARIIGIDLNPIALELKKDGFEIYIGDQEDPLFWQKLKNQIGLIDILLDDGGHKNGQQISTLFFGVDLIKNGGLIVIEDTHTSYFSRFGNPSIFSFINYSKRIVNKINSRFKFIKTIDSKFTKSIWSVMYFESIVSFSVNREKCKEGQPVINNGENIGAIDFRNSLSASSAIFSLEVWTKYLVHFTLFKKIVSKFFDFVIYIYEFIADFRLIKFYRK